MVKRSRKMYGGKISQIPKALVGAGFITQQNASGSPVGNMPAKMYPGSGSTNTTHGPQPLKVKAGGSRRRRSGGYWGLGLKNPVRSGGSRRRRSGGWGLGWGRGGSRRRRSVGGQWGCHTAFC